MMVKTERLSADHIDEISQAMRLGLGLALAGICAGLIAARQTGDFSEEAVLSVIGISGSLHDLFVTYVFGGPLSDYTTPANFLSFAVGFCLAGTISIITGFWLRFFGVLLAFLYGIPWLIGLVDSVPWIFFPEDYPTLQTSIASTYKLAMTMLYLMLANIGPGSYSLDHRFHLPGLVSKTLTWDTVALQIRFGLSFLFLGVATSSLVFGQANFSLNPYLTMTVGVLVLFGLVPRISGALAIFVIGWHLWVNLMAVNTVGLALDIFLPQTPFLAAALIFMLAGGGKYLTPNIQLTRTMWGHVDD